MLARLPALVIVTSALYLLWLIGKAILFKFVSIRRRWRRLIVGSWGRSTARIIGMRIELNGQPPRAPFFLVSNHLSYVDIVALSSCLDCVFVAKSEISGWPGLGQISRSIGTIFIDRRNFQDIPRVVDLIEGALLEAQGVVVFPEGTSTMGEKILPFSPALLEPAARAGYPVSYAAVSYRTPPDEPPAYLSICWWGEMTFVPHLIEMLKLKEFYVSVNFGPGAIQASDRKILARSLWSAVNQLKQENRQD